MPYAPGISYHGDEYLAQGINSAAQSLGSGIVDAAKFQQQQKEQDKILKQQADAADSVLSSGLTPDLNFTPGQLAAMSLGQKQGLIQAHTLRGAAAIQDQQLKLQAAQMQNEQTQGNILQQRFVGAQREQGAQANIADYLQRAQKQPASMMGGMFTPQANMQRGAPDAYLSAGGTDPDFYKLLQERFSPDTGQYTEDPVTGSRHIVLNRQVLPTGVNLAVAPKPDLPDIGHQVTMEDGTILYFNGQTNKDGTPRYGRVPAKPPVTGVGALLGAPAAGSPANTAPAAAAPAKPAAGPAAVPGKLYQVDPQTKGLSFAPDAVPLAAVSQMVKDGAITAEAGRAWLEKMGYSKKK